MSLQAYILAKGQKRQEAANKIAQRARLNTKKAGQPTANERKAVESVNQPKRQPSKFKSLVRNSAERFGSAKSKATERGFDKLKGWIVDNSYTMIPDADGDEQYRHGTTHSMFEIARKERDRTVAEAAALRESVTGEAFGAHIVARNDKQLSELNHANINFTNARSSHLLATGSDCASRDGVRHCKTNVQLHKCQPSNRPANVNTPDFKAANVDEPPAPKLLSVTLRHEHKIYPGRRQLIAESKLHLNINRDVSLPQLRYILQRHAAAAAFDDHVVPCHILGFPLLTYKGKTKQLTDEQWEILKSPYPSHGARLEFPFEVVKPVSWDGVDEAVDEVEPGPREMAFV